MDDTIDPLLENKSLQKDIVSVELDLFSDGLLIIGLSNDQINSLGSFINSLYQRVRDEHKLQVTRNGLTMLQGAIFAVGTKKLKNPEWKEHCASSLREIFHEWKEGDLSSDFILFYKKKGEKLTTEESDNFREFRLHYYYFSGIDHHNASMIQNSLINILKDNSLKLEDCYKDEIFIDRVKDFFLKLSKIFEFSNYYKK